MKKSTFRSAFAENRFPEFFRFGLFSALFSHSDEAEFKESCVSQKKTSKYHSSCAAAQQDFNGIV